ncbi:transmembrane channel-like protein 6 isoform X2 [Artibeus jamaicensis]|uniref:transmembrane channel-like protein 6 isoform X2 n=1 Tax=Artibeus jamaicensis TaxID=9417 RepID=UPI00235B0FCD|nr:transmembrane channel-like protein 6 isoform X2 [Artibeus jamaicensis]
MAFVLDVSETPEDQGWEPSPDDESEVHHSFHQLIREQSQRAAEEGLELQPLGLGAGTLGAETLGAAGSDRQALLGPEDAAVHSAATLRILASMPSRTIGRSHGAIISQFYNRTVQLRRRASRPPLGDLGHSARPSLRLYDLELDSTALEEEEKRALLVKELQGLTLAQRDHMLRGMPLGLAEKRRLREETRTPRGKQRGRPRFPSCCSRFPYARVPALHHLGPGLLLGLRGLAPWHYTLKQIGGQFGSSALSYFLFLKTLLAFNVLLLLPLLAFVVGVQAAFPPAPRGPVPTFTGLELLTGGGRFTDTVMYYGYYSNVTLNRPCASQRDGDQCAPEAASLPYSMPLAYLFTVGAAFFITCITLVYSMSRSFGESYRVGSASGAHAVTVFCSWDHKVTQRRASRLQHDNIRTQLKELLAEWQLQRRPRGLCGRLRRAAVLALAWLLCLGTTLGCTVAVYAFSEFTIKSPVSAEREGALLGLPFVVGLLNLAAPYLYRGLAVLERQDSPVMEVYVAICRNLILKMVVLGILCYHWLGRRVGALKDQCWENFVGQELYRLVVTDFLFTLLDTLFGELVWRLISEKQLRRGKPEFDIARNVLELIYGQTLTWLGVLFSPLLPAVQVIKLLLLFYVKKWGQYPWGTAGDGVHKTLAQQTLDPWRWLHTSDPRQAVPTCLGLPSVNGVWLVLPEPWAEIRVFASLLPALSWGPTQASPLFPWGSWGKECGWVVAERSLCPQTSLMANCQAPRRPWLASHMSTVFISLLCFPSFLGAAIFLCYATWQVKPSDLCGPFRTLDTMYEAGKVWVHRLERAGPRVSWLSWVHRYLVENTFPVYLVSALLLAMIYLNIQVVKGQRKVISLLKEQISNEGEDKIFLINKIHSVCERKDRSRAGRTQAAATPPAMDADNWDPWQDSSGPSSPASAHGLGSVPTALQTQTPT